MKTLKLIFIICLIPICFIIKSCCLDEVCRCSGLKLKFVYNFDTTTTNHFPIEEINNFKIILINSNNNDTLRVSQLNRKYKGTSFEIYIRGELSELEQNKSINYYIVNEKLDYKDSITNIDYEYTSVVDCNEHQNESYCGTADCILFDESSVSFEFNGKKYSYSDSPITVNYEKK